MKSPAFDPYHEWLAIPSAHRPPTHYQILGVAESESNPKVIETAAIRQSTFLRAFQAGEHAASANKILNEIAEARAVLLDPKRRKDYDARRGLNAAKFTPPSSPKVEVVPEVRVDRIRDRPDSSVRISAPHSKDSYGLSGKQVRRPQADEVELDEQVETEILYSAVRRRSGARSNRRKSIDPAIAWSIGVGAVVLVLLSTIFLIRTMNRIERESMAGAPTITEQPNGRQVNPKITPDFSNQKSANNSDSRPFTSKPENNPSPSLTDKKPERKPDDPTEPGFQLSSYHPIKDRSLKLNGQLKYFALHPRDDMENECLVEDALSILNDPNSELHSAAFEQLAACTPNARAEEVLAYAQEPRKLDANLAAIDVIALWDLQSASSKLTPLLETGTSEQKSRAIVAIGRTKDMQALETLMHCLTEPVTRKAATEALIAFGRNAERKVLELEASKEAGNDIGLRIALLKILTEIGGKESLKQLKLVIGPLGARLPNSIRDIAEIANRAIRDRIDDEELAN